jgi:hypothetical protein
MKKLIISFIVFLAVVSVNATAQNVSINNTGAVPNTNAMLDIDVSTNDMGLLIPRLTTGERTGIIGLGVLDEGLTVYDETTNSYWLWDGTQWVEFGMFGDDWALIGNAGTNPATNFLGTTDAQDLVIRTNNVEKMRVESGGDVGIGITNPPYRLTVADALNASVNESASVIATTYSIGFSDNDALHEDIYGVMGVADNSTYGSSAMDFGYGVVGLSETGFQGGVGVYGSPNNLLVRFNWDIGVAAAYDVDRYATIGEEDLGFYSYFNASYNGNTYGAYLNLDNDFNSSTIGKIGMNILNTATYGLKYGIRIENTGVAQSKYGIVTLLDGLAVTDAINGAVYYGNNANTQGWGMLLASGNTGVSYLTGGGGIFSKSRDFAIIGTTTLSTSTGIVGIGQNYALIHTLVGGSGISGAGTITGVYGYADNAASSEGGVFAGNGQSPSTLGSGSGVAATGTEIGVFGNATSSSTAGTGSWGGYFTNGRGSFAYVGGSVGGWPTDYKINGSGSVSTIVDDLNEEPVNMFCPEAPEILFQDYGTGELVNGKAYIKMDPIFTKNIHVDEDSPIKVFVQLEGDCKGVYVTNKTAQGFEVVELQGGYSSVPFSWTVTATRADRMDEAGNLSSKHVGVRFPRGPKRMETETLETNNTEIIDVDPDLFNGNEEERLNREVEEIEIPKIK